MKTGLVEVPGGTFTSECYEYWGHGRRLIWTSTSYGPLISSDRWSVYLPQEVFTKLQIPTTGRVNCLLETDEDTARRLVETVGKMIDAWFDTLWQLSSGLT